VNGPDGRLERSLELEEDGAVLLGRAPKPELLRKSFDEGARVPTVASVSAPSISANHLLAWTERGALFLEDLGSRNGTWLLLPRNVQVRVGEVDVVLQLARAVGDAQGVDEPATPAWNGRPEFARALATSIEQWPRLRALDVEVRIAEQAGDPASHGYIPLASGEALDILPRATVDASWWPLLERLWHWVVRQNSIYEAEQQTRDEGMILASAPIRAAHREVVEVAQSGARTLLLTGPSGAGKERLAEAFHRHAARSGPFVAVNCSMFSKDLLRSELFGADSGAFTGATRRIVGAVERAQGGTLFLDEIGDMPSDVQPMLLRFLDRREFEQLGQYGKMQKADVLVVAATNRDLRAAARDGVFRADLWYRLCVQVVDVPPLRERWEDVIAYLESTRTADGKHPLREVLTKDALELLRGHAWDGNFRELTNFRERLPRDATPSSVDVAACRRALERGSLRPLSPPAHAEPVAAGRTDWAPLVAQAVSAFVEDNGHEPTSWDDQKEWNEKYLKPLLFYQLSEAAALPAPADDEALSSLASRAATRVRADRGTALKQLARYFTRFRG
jgi:DNA-binding NtrC family response regulator